MNISVLHATEMEPVENAWCVLQERSNGTDRCSDREIFIGESSWKQGYRLACQSYPTGSVRKLRFRRTRKKR